MTKLWSVDRVLPLVLIGMTAVTGLLDAVSFLGLGHVFTANMTGNVVFLAFAIAGVAKVSVGRSFTALLAYLAGATLGGRIMARSESSSPVRSALFVFVIEFVLLSCATICAIGCVEDVPKYPSQLYWIIAFTAVAMGMRNATVRKLGVPELTTTVLTMTITGLAADSPLAEGSNRGWRRRIAGVVAMFTGAGFGALAIRHSVFLAMAIASGISLLSTFILILALRASAPASSQRQVAA